MGPTKIMVIRHAEEPVPGKVEGVRARGELDNSSLTALGWQRAGALVSFFENPKSRHIARPDHLFAVRCDISDASSSRRPRQTLRPLSLDYMNPAHQWASGTPLVDIETPPGNDIGDVVKAMKNLYSMLRQMEQALRTHPLLPRVREAREAMERDLIRRV